jgi:hypothetical protein
MGKIIIKPINNMMITNFLTDPLAEKYVDIIYVKRMKSKLGRMIFGKTIRRIKMPSGVKITLIANNRPRIGFLTIIYRKK